MHLLCVCAAVAAVPAFSVPAVAQCPDGTPPPCSAPRRAPRRAPPPDPAQRRRSFLVLPFRNLSRAADQNWLIEGSPVLLADALSKRTEITVVPDERLYPALRRNGLTPGDVMDLGRVRRVAEETGGWTAVTGDVMAIGGGVRVTARAFDVVTAAEVLRATEEAGPGEDVRALYLRLGQRMIRAVGLDSAAAPLAAAAGADTGGATRSIDAYRAYVQGLVHVNRSEFRRARDAFQTAVRLDSGYAQAWRRLAETEISLDPRVIADPQSALYRDMARAVALADRLPPNQREVVLAVNAFLGARVGDARERLARLIAQDSNDVDAIEWMANLEGFDPVLVPRGGGERPRGSLNNVTRLAKRVLELDPARHQMYSSLVESYILLGGGAPGVVFGYRRSAQSLSALMAGGGPDRVFVPLLLDSIVLVPQDSFETVPADTVAESRRRALDVARRWARRWIQAGPNEAEAHLWASRVYAQSDSPAVALAELEKADSLGVESGLENVSARRMGLLARLGRYADGARIADSLWRAGALPVEQVNPFSLDGLGWAYTLFVLGGHTDRASEMLARLANAVAAAAISRPDLGAAGFAEVLLSGQAPQYFSPPPAVRVAVVDTLLHAAAVVADTTLVVRGLPFAVVMLMEDTLVPNRPAIAQRALQAAQRLAPAHPDLAYQLIEAAAWDSSARRAADTVGFYRTRRAEVRRADAAIARRFQPGTATVADSIATFTWLVSDTTPFTWARIESPIAQSEYQWQVDFDAGDRHYEALAAVSRTAVASPTSGGLQRLLNNSQRMVHEVVSADTTVPHRTVSRSAVRIEPVTGGFRLVLRDSALVGALRRERPAQLRFRFRPCGREPDDAAPRCVDEMVAVLYP